MIAGDAVQSTAASQPLLLSHNGVDNYWWGSGVSGNFVSTPNAVANQITGDIEIIAQIQMQSYSVLGGQTILAKGNISTGAGTSYALIYSSSTLNLVLGVGASLSDNNSTALLSSVFTANQIGWVKATRTGSSIRFYTSNDGSTWTQLGTTLTRAGTLNTVAIVEIGTANTGATAPFQGKIYRATISNSIGGAPVVDFNPAQYNAATSQTAWTSATGEVWTINTGTATSGYKGCLVSRNIVMSDGVDDTMSATIAITGVKSGYWAIKRLADATKSVTDALVANKFNLYTNVSTGLNIYTATGDLASSGLTRNVLSQFAVVNNGASSSISKNDGTKTTGTLNNNTLTGVKLFNGADGFSNFIINTHLITAIADSNANQTATYNLIRSLNENAF